MTIVDKWIYDKVAFYQLCPNCGLGIVSELYEVLLEPENFDYHFCPNCGKHLKEVVNNEKEKQ